MLKNVEAAAFKMPVGDISDVIEDQGKFYLLKLISRENGNVQPFDGMRRSRTDYAGASKTAARGFARENRQHLLQDAIVTSTPEMIDRCVDMAMQNYQKWRTEK